MTIRAALPSLLAVFLLLPACGGGLKTVKLDMAGLSKDNRAKIQAKQDVVHKARDKSKKAKKGKKAAGARSLRPMPALQSSTVCTKA